MPQKSEDLSPNWDNSDDECQHILLNCAWTITSANGTLTVVITCLKWTFNHDFWIRVTAHPEGNPHISKQIDINKHNPLLESLSEALDEYEDFPEPHLNSHQLHIGGELLDSLPWKNILSTMANTHLAYPDLAIDKFSGTDPDQDAESFIQLFERKINFALGDSPADSGELVNYTFRKKLLFSSLPRGLGWRTQREQLADHCSNPASTMFNFRLRFIRNYPSGQLTKRPVYSEAILPTRVNCGSPRSCHCSSSIMSLNPSELLLCQTLPTPPVLFSLTPPNHFSITSTPVSCRVIANAWTIAQRKEKKNF